MSSFGFALGVILALFTWAMVVKKLLFTRGDITLLERGVILSLRFFYSGIGRGIRSSERRHSVLSTLAPVALLLQLAVWLLLFVLAYALMLWPFGEADLPTSVRVSASSLFTLGFAVPSGSAPTALVITAAATGIVVVALYIAYLPTLYGHFGARETAVSHLASRVGIPPWGPNLLARTQEYQLVETLSTVYERWDQLAAEIGVATRNYPLLAWFRGPDAQTSWITSLNAALDSAALYLAVAPESAPAECRAFIRTGSTALAQISQTIRLTEPSPGSRDVATPLAYEDFVKGFDVVRQSGFSVSKSASEAWEEFCSQRALYERSARAVATSVLAPPAPWFQTERRGPPHALASEPRR